MLLFLDACAISTFIMITKRSIIIDGSVTSISMEPIFWQEIDLRAECQGVPWQDYMRRLIKTLPEVANRSSAIRQQLVQLLQDEGGRQGRQRLQALWQINRDDTCQNLKTLGVRLFAGRSAVNQLVLDDTQVSRRHALLVYDGEAWWAIDLHSKNGVWANDSRRELVRLVPGETITLGESHLTLLQTTNS